MIRIVRGSNNIHQGVVNTTPRMQQTNYNTKADNSGLNATPNNLSP